MSYKDEWRQAVARTTKHGLVMNKEFTLVDQPYLTERRKEEFPYVIKEKFGLLESKDLVAQCISVHLSLVPTISDWLSCPVAYTIGWIDNNSERGLFKFDEDSILSMLNNPRQGGVVNIHTWLTLPSLEIIDVVLASSIAYAQRKPEFYGNILAGHADDFAAMRYKPMLVGEDFLLKSGLISFKLS